MRIRKLVNRVVVFLFFFCLLAGVSPADEAGKKKSEFGGSGYDHQKDHLTKTQVAGKTALGRDFIAFGSPFNA
ncbi:MAG: hypothetical protein KJ717_04555, partial [Proteobacteria bacterium]|nr:hypothetical protein [Pseudomonadota bacterium]